jgi:branched-chain amino acid transport system ATP-binding protein
VSTLLAVRDLHVRYGGAILALRGVDLELAQGQVAAVLGSNGAGKTTLLRAICGNLRTHRGELTTGEVQFEGRDLGQLDAAARVRLGLVQVPEGRRIFGRLTVEENLRVGLRVLNGASARAQALADVLDLFPVLRDRSRQRAGLLSGGEQQMLAIGRALVTRPRLLVLDEPSLGLAPRIITRIGELVRQINEGGTSVLLVEQNAAMALRVADHAVVLEQGVVRLRGGSAELRASEEVRRLYLGHSGVDEASDQPDHEAADVPGGSAAADPAPARPQLARWPG